MTNAEIAALFESLRDEIGVWATRQDYFMAGWNQSRRQALHEVIKHLRREQKNNDGHSECEWAFGHAADIVESLLAEKGTSDAARGEG